MATTLIRISAVMNPGPVTITLPGNAELITADALGFLIIQPEGVAKPDVQRKFEILDPARDLADPDFTKYRYIGGIGAAGRQVFERALD